MADMPTQISNFIESQFPEIYQEDGQNFIAFIKAYYEWLEQNFQLLSLEDPTGFEVGSVIQQGDLTGTVIAKIEDDLLVKVDGNETFACVSVCSSLEPVTTGSFSSLIARGGTTRRLGPIFQARNIRNYTDIDKTIDLFVVQFKEKYLKNIQFDVATNQRLLVKSSLDLYRSKGSERSIDLFFRLVYGINAEVRRPSDFLFKPSEAEWAVPKYIEISSINPQRSIALVGKEITGVTSGASAFVEKYVKLKTPTGFSHILFVSNVKGNFLLKEILKDQEIFPDSPIIYGSMTGLEISNPVGQFEIGDLIDLESNTGFGGKGRVVEVRFASGQVDFELEFGGYGYNVMTDGPDPLGLESNVLIADALLSLSNVDIGNTVQTASATVPGSGYANDDIITFTSNYGKDAFGLLITDGAGAISEVQMMDYGSGFIYPSPNDIPVAITTSGGTGATVLPAIDYPRVHMQFFEPIQQTGIATSPTGFTMTPPKRGVVTISSIVGEIAVGQTLLQVDPTLGVVASALINSINQNLNEATIVVENIEGCFRKDFPVQVGDSTGVLSTIDTLTFSIKQNAGDPFILDETSEISGNVTGFRGTPSLISGGQNADFSITSITEQESVVINIDVLDDVILALPLNTPGLTTLPFPDFFTAQTVNIGKVRTIGSINPGEGYTSDPEVITYQPLVAPFRKKDLDLRTSDEIGSFSINEIVEQTINLEVKEFSVSNTSGFFDDAAVFITDTGGNTIASGTIFSVTSTTTLEVQGLDNLQDYSGEDLRLVEDALTTRTILSDSTAPRSTLARGIVKSSSDGFLNIERLTFRDDYEVGNRFVGISSGASANVQIIYEEDTDQFLGFNANVVSETVTSNGAVSQIEVVDSGFGFLDGQNGTFEFAPGLDGSFRVLNGGVGTGSGSYRSIKGFASDQSKLFDGDYWQEYSYDIMSRIPIDKYSDMFKKVMHTAGTRFFGSVLIDTELDISNKGGFTNSDRTLTTESEIIVGNSSPYTVESSTLEASPTPWNPDPSTVSPDLRDPLRPTVDRNDINIEVRN